MATDVRMTLLILAVEDLPRSVQFYRTAFAWPQHVDVPSYAEFNLPGDMRVGLYRRTGFAQNTGREPQRLAAGASTATELYFHTDDMDAAIERLLLAGATLLSDLAPRDWGDEAAYFADPDGNVVVLARRLTGADG